MARTTHFTNVSGIEGVFAGANGSEVRVASSTGQLYQSGVAVTATAAEMNIMDGVTASAAELNILDGVTATAAELNLNDGAVAGTAVASKTLALGADKNVDTLAIADSGLKLGAGAGTAVTSTAAELNLVDGSVAGTAVASKALALGADKNVDTLAIADGGLKLGAGAGTAVTATAAELNAYAVTAYMADANTAGSGYVVCPHAGNIIGVSVVNYVTNTTTATVYTAKIGGVSVTHPALQHGATDVAGTGVTVVPTATNTVTANQVVEVASDGGGTPVMPITVTLLISR